MSADNVNNTEHQKSLLKKISDEFPHIAWSSYRYVDEGWDHEVIILDEKIVFRFPTDQQYTHLT
jgi:aminoglycoside 2''-phosphotransferase